MKAAKAQVAPVDGVIANAVSVLGRTQEEDGSWKGDYGGPLFLVPVYVAGMHLMGKTLPASQREGFVRYLRNHQNPDGGFGLDVESHSHVMTSVLNYVALRLLGLSPDDEVLRRCREWFLPHGGPLSSGSWGKFTLALLGLYDYQGLDPVLPELWLLPEQLPVHPSKLWCHCRMVYLPMSWLYAQRIQAEPSPLLEAIKQELYPEPYGQIDWEAARTQVAATDAYTPRTSALKVANKLMGLYERGNSAALREKALAFVLEQIRAEDEATHFICIGPINKVFNTVVWHFANPGGPEVSAHLERMGDYLYQAKDGLKVNGYNSSQLWDTAFAVQALVKAEAVPGAREILEKAAGFMEANQVLEDTRDPSRFFRHPSKGGWPFSTREHGWPISDCTAEGLKASLALEPLGLNKVSRPRLKDAVDLILSLQNEDGGWATYELQRGPKLLEALNPSDVFSTIMVDVSYVECTSACVQALSAWQAAAGETRRVKAAIAMGVKFLRNAQREDGSWEGSWGVCFSYGTWFGVTGLVAAGVDKGDPAIRKAVEYLEAHQRKDGAWSELAESCRQRRWVEGKRGHAVNTSWALLTLAAAGKKDSLSARRGVQWLRDHQQEDGSWPEEPLAGVFNRTSAIHYDAYLKLFPLWALMACG